MSPRNSSRALTLGLLAALALALAAGVGGCGSGSSASSTSAPAKPAATGSSSNGGTAKGATGGDPGIKEFGATAAGADKAAVSAAAHAFFVAMADRADSEMCADLAAANREQLSKFGAARGRSGGCAKALSGLLDPAVAAEARRAAAAPIASVRIKGGNAFAIFTPRGGSPSYLVMKREGGGWKAISVTPGTPIDPSATR